MTVYYVISLLVVVTFGVYAAANRQHRRLESTDTLSIEALKAAGDSQMGRCGTGHVACNEPTASGRCIPLTSLCDGYADCVDNWDETPSVCDGYVYLAADDPDYCSALMWDRCKFALDQYTLSFNVTMATIFSNIAAQPAMYLCQYLYGFNRCMAQKRRWLCQNIPLDELERSTEILQLVGTIRQFACRLNYTEYETLHNCASQHLNNGLNFMNVFQLLCDVPEQHNNGPTTQAAGICRYKPTHDCVTGIAERYCGQEVARIAKDFQEYFFECSLGD